MPASAGAPKRQPMQQHRRLRTARRPSGGPLSGKLLADAGAADSSKKTSGAEPAKPEAPTAKKTRPRSRPATDKGRRRREARRSRLKPGTSAAQWKRCATATVCA